MRHTSVVILAALAAMAALPAQLAADSGPDGTRFAAAQIDAMDINGDGFIDQHETDALIGKVFSYLDIDRDGSIARQDLGPGGLKLDVNRDGLVDATEFLAPGRAFIRRGDRNADGRLSLKEVRELGSAATRPRHWADSR